MMLGVALPMLEVKVNDFQTCHSAAALPRADARPSDP